jgi:hypothetical protein
MPFINKHKRFTCWLLDRFISGVPLGEELLYPYQLINRVVNSKRFYGSGYRRFWDERYMYGGVIIAIDPDLGDIDMFCCNDGEKNSLFVHVKWPEDELTKAGLSDELVTDYIDKEKSITLELITQLDIMPWWVSKYIF